MEVEEIFEKIRGICRHYPAIEKAWLFGSHAIGDATDRSDIDLAIEGIPFGDPTWHVLLEKLDGLPTLRMIDCHNLSIASENLKQEIFKEGVILYERKKN